MSQGVRPPGRGVAPGSRAGDPAGWAGNPDAPAPPGRRTLRGRTVALALVVAAFAIAGLIAAIAWTNRAEKRMTEPPVGAGAGRTGMHNEHSGLGR